MLKKRIEISECLQDALKSPPDYSEAFTRRVSALVKKIQDGFAAPVEHDSDMNYASGQKIVVWLDKNCQPVSSRNREAVFRLEDHISSRGPFFTFITLRLNSSSQGWKERGLKKTGAYWIALAEVETPAAIDRHKERIATIMASAGYTLVDGAILAEEVEGEVTQLEEKPATVFEVLFGELH